MVCRPFDSVDEIYLYWVVSIAELAGAAWDHSLHMTLGKIRNI
jgi:saccharopine dehydrogenase (NAD+, L-lysine-forming)